MGCRIARQEETVHVAHTRLCQEGDLYLQKAEAITAKVPYMVCVGNHERGAGDRYRHYIARLYTFQNDDRPFW